MTDIAAVPPSLNYCVAAMRGSMALRGQALQIELAVSLVVYHTCGSSDLAAKKVLRAVYAASGIDCIKQDSASYRTIARRIDRSAGLYDKVKHSTIAKWLNGKDDTQTIDAVVAGLKPLNLNSMDDVLTYTTGKKREKEAKPRTTYTPELHPLRRAEDAEAVVVLDTEHIHIGVPAGVSADELEEAAEQLIELADRVRAGDVELKAA